MVTSYGYSRMESLRKRVSIYGEHEHQWQVPHSSHALKVSGTE